MKNKRLLLFATTIILATTGTSLKINKDKSNELVNHVNEYIEEFTEDNFDIAAHRGFSSIEIENTKEAIEEAANKDYVDYIEIDVRLTKDKKLVLSHNNKLKVNDESYEKISKLTLDELDDIKFKYYRYPLSLTLNNYLSYENKLISERSSSLSNKTYQVISLSEALDLFQDKKILLDIKFKDNNIEELVTELLKELKRVNTDNIILQSANLQGILYLQNNTNYKCLALIDSIDDIDIINLFDNVGIRKNLVTHDLVENMLDEEKTVAIWTIDSKKELTTITKQLDDLYEDVIYITDYPDLIATYLNDEQEKRLTKK
jgi:glycerophosphoryl diester phosphodiesterase